MSTLKKYAFVKFTVFAITMFLYTIGSANFIRTSTFVTHSSNILQILSTSKFAHLKNINADILFVGDSTAVVGVNPEIVSDISGLASYNLSLTVGSFIAVGDTMLDRYLELNRPPKFIVLYIGPWTTPSTPEAMVRDNAFGLQYPSWEATFALINFASTREIIDYFVHYPWQLKSLLRLSITQFWRGFESGPGKRARINSAIERHQGWVPLAAGIAGVATFRGIPDGCRYPAWEMPPDVKFIDHFRQRYATSTTTVLVFVSPIPDCDESIDYLTQAYSGVADLLPRTLPHQYFAYDTPRHNHLLEVGSDVNSEEIGEMFRDLLQ